MATFILVCRAPKGLRHLTRGRSLHCPGDTKISSNWRWCHHGAEHRRQI